MPHQMLTSAVVPDPQPQAAKKPRVSLKKLFIVRATKSATSAVAKKNGKRGTGKAH